MTTRRTFLVGTIVATATVAFSSLARAESQVRTSKISIVSNLINYQHLGFAIDCAAYPKLAKYADGIVALDVFREARVREKTFAEQMGLDRKFLQ